METYGDTFGEGGYWYENARVEPFFRVLFHIATEGRVQLTEAGKGPCTAVHSAPRVSTFRLQLKHFSSLKLG